MTFLDLDRRSSSRVLSRSSYLSVVRAGLKAGKYRFAREAAIAWLAAFPGDLSMSLAYGKALIGEERFTQALPILQGLCMVDPEFQEAAYELYRLQDALVQNNLVGLEGGGVNVTTENAPVNRKIVFAPGEAINAYYYILSGETEDEQRLPSWATDLRLARWYLAQNQFPQAEQMIRQVLSLQTEHPLIAVTHLHYLAQNQAIHNLEIRQKSAERYLKTWPDSLACILYYADWRLENGDSTQAVALLHQAAARDIDGQVPRRIWGDSHPYLPLWPQSLQLAFEQSIPADVASILGWNQLPSQVDRLAIPENEVVSQPLPWEDETSLVSKLDGVQLEDLPVIPEDSTQPTQDFDQLIDPGLILESTQAASSPVSQELDGEEKVGELHLQTGRSASEPEKADQEQRVIDEPIWDDPKATAEDLLPMKQALEKMAKKLRLPGITQQDGRFPVYVILSLKNSLDRLYGEPVAKIIVEEMENLATAVRQRKRWDSRVFMPDDLGNLESLAIKPVDSSTAWQVKLALNDLDLVLSKRGEMIGAVLIVGGPEIVPFHALPNPVDDQDNDVPSDNPYATRDENYFMPEWPVGRLPGGDGTDASLLLAVLRRLTTHHLKYGSAKPWYSRWLSWLFRDGASKNSSFGYTAAVWRKAAESVFSPIGEPKSINSSPPLGLSGLEQEKSTRNGRKASIPALKASLAYFNLHGMEDAVEWYGQRDPLDPQDGPDYPVALRPQDIAVNGRFRKKIPQVVFSEACYGLHVYGREIDQAISLKFLEAGSLAVIGSTCMSYGSIDAPLVAADLLGHAFWKYFKEGLPAGEALRQAKIHLAKVMNARQGYLDGEDQKTIISFVLYGDPLAAREIYYARNKSIWRHTRSSQQVMTVCDRKKEADGDAEIPEDVMQSVRQVVSQYLPGMANAQMAYSIQRKACEGEGHSCPSSEMNKNQQPTGQLGTAAQHKASGNPENEAKSAVRRLVTLNKQIPNSHGVHSHVARLTLDENGKLVKLVVSR